MDASDWIALGAGIVAIVAAYTSWSQAKSSRTSADQTKNQALAADEQVRLMRRQLQQAETAQQEQNQPYVIVDIQPHENGLPVLVLVIENIGSTVARNVRISATPPLESAWGQDLTDALQEALGTTIRMLAPGRRLVYLFDDQKRFGSSLPQSYDFKVDCEGPYGAMEQMRYTADIGSLKAALIIDRPTAQMEKSLKELHKQVKSLAELYGRANAPSIREERSRELEQHRAARRAIQPPSAAGDAGEGQ